MYLYEICVMTSQACVRFPRAAATHSKGVCMYVCIYVRFASTSMHSLPLRSIDEDTVHVFVLASFDSKGTTFLCIFFFARHSRVCCFFMYTRMYI